MLMVLSNLILVSSTAEALIDCAGIMLEIFVDFIHIEIYNN